MNDDQQELQIIQITHDGLVGGLPQALQPVGRIRSCLVVNRPLSSACASITRTSSGFPVTYLTVGRAEQIVLRVHRRSDLASLGFDASDQLRRRQKSSLDSTAYGLFKMHLVKGLRQLVWVPRTVAYRIGGLLHRSILKESYRRSNRNYHVVTRRR
jgi:hypothetical protein